MEAALEKSEISGIQMFVLTSPLWRRGILQAIREGLRNFAPGR